MSYELMSPSSGARRLKRLALHSARVAMFLLVLAFIRLQQAEISDTSNQQSSWPVATEQLRKFYPLANSVADANVDGRRAVLGDAGQSLGYVLQTSPDGDDLIGFSGPTNVLIAFANNDRILGIDVLTSGDTREHVEQVLQDDTFLHSFVTLTWEQAASLRNVDGVSGATLTSLTVQESIVRRLSGGRPSLKFPDALSSDDAGQLFEEVGSVVRDDHHQSLWHVFDAQSKELGSVLLTAPHADGIIGYQGPTNTMIGFDRDGRVIGISAAKSYDNEPYVTYVREDDYFRQVFNDQLLGDLANLSVTDSKIEGVSGATMTSMAVAEGLIVAAQQHQHALTAPTDHYGSRLNWSIRDLGTFFVIFAGLTISLTRLRGNNRVRICFQLLLIVYLGLINGDMVSQAMIVGWAKNSIPWQSAGGLVMLTAAAIVVPITTRRNSYCTHLCPHGAVQHLLKDRLPLQLRLPRWASRTLKCLPGLLLTWCVVVAAARLSFSLVDIEPFDAWVFRVAGWATISVAIVGLAASLFVPMAYCRFGCPTGAMLGFLRFNSRSDRWSRQDWFALTLLGISFGLWLVA